MAAAGGVCERQHGSQRWFEGALELGVGVSVTAGTGRVGVWRPSREADGQFGWLCGPGHGRNSAKWVVLSCRSTKYTVST